LGLNCDPAAPNSLPANPPSCRAASCCLVFSTAAIGIFLIRRSPYSATAMAQIPVCQILQERDSQPRPIGLISVNDRSGPDGASGDCPPDQLRLGDRRYHANCRRHQRALANRSFRQIIAGSNHAFSFALVYRCLTGRIASFLLLPHATMLNPSQRRPGYRGVYCRNEKAAAKRIC
jgi:hypothetical protein